MSATSSRLPSAAHRGDRGDGEQHEQDQLPARGPRAERRCGRAVEGRQREPPVAEHAAPPRPRRPARAASARSPAVTPSRSPNSSSPSRGGTSGDSASIAPSPSSEAIATATPTSPPSRSVARRPARSRRRRPARPPTAPSTQRHAGQRGDDQPRQHPVADRLRRVALPVEQHPDAERPAGDREDQHLGQRAPTIGDRERVGEPGQHQCSCAWCPTPTARPPALEHDQLGAVGLAQRLGGEHRRRAARSRSGAPCRQSDAVPAARLARRRAWRRAGSGPRRAARRTRPRSARRWRRRRPTAARRAAARGASWTQRARDQHALALAAGERAERRLRARSASPTRSSAARAASRSARASRRHARRAAVGAHQRDVEAR